MHQRRRAATEDSRHQGGCGFWQSVADGPATPGGHRGSPGCRSQRLQKAPGIGIGSGSSTHVGGGSQKRIEPSYNADLTVTRHGIIVSQFLTNEASDFDHLKKALPFVVGTLGRPDAWAGDGHYATHANILLTDQAGVTLYAPMLSLERKEGTNFTAVAFRHDPEKDVLICPGGEELYRMGQASGIKNRPAPDLYRRSDCTGCELKARCTKTKSKVQTRGVAHHFLPAHEKRMNEMGERIDRFRRQTVEPVNGQIKQHGLGRLRVRGLSRGGVMLTLACFAHNLMKWKGREAARALARAA